MELACGRPGCTTPSVAALKIDAENSVVRLTDLSTSSEGIALCPKHANATSAPVGWNLHDDRSAETAVVEEAVVEPSDPAIKVAARPARRRSTENLSGDRVGKFPFGYAFEADDEPADLKVDSPLLARAFRSSKAK